MDAPLVLGLLTLVGLALGTCLVMWLFLRTALMAERIAEVVQLRVHRSTPVPGGRPIQDIAGNIRRLGTAYNEPALGRSWVKSEAIRRAYDDALVDGCRALGIVTRLTELAPGFARDVERIRVETALAAAGLFLPKAG